MKLGKGLEQGRRILRYLILQVVTTTKNEIQEFRDSQNYITVEPQNHSGERTPHEVISSFHRKLYIVAQVCVQSDLENLQGQRWHSL